MRGTGCEAEGEGEGDLKAGYGVILLIFGGCGADDSW